MLKDTHGRIYFHLRLQDFSNTDDLMDLAEKFADKEQDWLFNQYEIQYDDGRGYKGVKLHHDDGFMLRIEGDWQCITVQYYGALQAIQGTPLGNVLMDLVKQYSQKKT